MALSNIEKVSINRMKNGWHLLITRKTTANREYVFNTKKDMFAYLNKEMDNPKEDDNGN